MTAGAKGILYLNGTSVGDVELQHVADSWSYGRFTPGAGFSSFAPLFGRWSLLMHADEGAERLNPDAAEELRRCEYDLLKIEARMFFPQTHQWVNCAELNIDGGMIEWKSF